MLAPDALGCLAINKDQWRLRTQLQQNSVWGEQPSPEEIESLIYAAFHPEDDAPSSRLLGSSDVTASPAIGKRTGNETKSGGNRTIAWDTHEPRNVAAFSTPCEPIHNPSALALAACVNEEVGSIDVPPPQWMKSCCIMPAPRLRLPGPPIPEVVGRPNLTSSLPHTANDDSWTNGHQVQAKKQVDSSATETKAIVDPE